MKWTAWLSRHLRRRPRPADEPKPGEIWVYGDASNPFREIEERTAERVRIVAAQESWVLFQQPGRPNKSSAGVDWFMSRYYRSN